MDIVINIRDDYYEALKKSWLTRGSRNNGKLIIYNICDAIINGVQIPKGHGDLVDRDEILANFVAARAELSGEFDEGLHEAWEIVNSEDATPAIIKGERSDS